jgi:outer membrane protein assembly factor BamB
LKTRRTKIWLSLAILVVAPLILSSCGGATPVLGASWPGLVDINDTLYLSYSKVYALNTDGTPKWSFPEKLESNQGFFAPPAADDKLVVVTDYTDSVFGLDPADGTQKWVFKSNRSRFIGGPVLGDSLVYAATADGTVHAISRDTSSGTAKQAWSFSAESSIWATPLLADGTLYVTSMDKHVYALDAQTGELQWKFPDETSAPENPPIGGIVGTPTLHKGVLYFGSFNNRLYALDIQTHKVLWRYDTSNWVWGSPVVDDATGYVIGADLDGHIFAIDSAGGDPAKAVWQVDAKPAAAGAKVSVVGSPVLRTMDDGTTVAYFTCDGDPNLYVLNIKDGSNVLPPKTVTNVFQTTFLIIPTGSNTRPVKLYPAPVFTDDTLMVATHDLNEKREALFALDGKTLAEKWKVSLNDADNAIQAKTAPPSDQAPQDQGGLLGNPINTLLLITAVFLLVSLVLRPQRGGKK